MAAGKFIPRVFCNQRPILTPADLNNHPLAGAYIEYLRHVKYPLDFKGWQERRENDRAAKDAEQRMILAAALNDPFCRSPNKRRKF